MSTSESSALELLRSSSAVKPKTDSATSALALLRASSNPVVSEEEDKNDLLQAGAGVLEGILDPLSVIPFVDRRLQQMQEYRGNSTAGKIGYGIGAIGGFMLPLAPANLTLRAGTATARGLKLVKSIDSSEDVIKLADKMTELSHAGTFVQGAVSGGLMGAGTGEGLVETDSRMLDALQGAAFGGIADVALTPIWRAISGIGKTAKTLPGEVKDLATQTLKTSAEDNAPVIANERTAALIGRALTLADNVLPSGGLEEKTELGLNIARSLKSIEAGELRVIPSVGKNHAEFVKAMKDEGFDIIEAHTAENVSSFLVGAKGTLGEDLAKEFSHYGFIKGQDIVGLGGKVKGMKGTILGLGEKPGMVKVLFPGKKVREVPKEELYYLPSGYTKAVKKSIGKASSLWGEFEQSYADSFSSDTLADAAQKLGIATGEMVEKPAVLSFDGAFEKFAKDKEITGAQKVALKDYFVKRQTENLKTFAAEEIEILEKLGAFNKGAHPEGALVEKAALSGYKVVKTKQNGKIVHAVRDVDNAQVAVFKSRSMAEKFVENHRRELPDALEGVANPVSNDLLNTGGIAASVDEAGREPMLSPKSIMELGSRKGLFGILRSLRLNPRGQELLAVEEVAAKNGDYFPIWSEVFNPLNEWNTKWVNKRSPYLNEAVKLAKGFFTKNIRPEKNADWVRLMESDPKTWHAHTAEEVVPGRAAKMVTKTRPVPPPNARVTTKVTPGQEYDEVVERTVRKPTKEKLDLEPQGGGAYGLSQADIDALLGGTTKPVEDVTEVVKETIRRRGPDKVEWNVEVDGKLAGSYASKEEAERAMQDIIARAPKEVSENVVAEAAVPEVTKRVQRKGLIEELGLSPKEVKAAQAARALFKKVWDNEAADVGMTADQYIEFYWPRMREFSQRENPGETFADFLRREAMDRKFKATEKDIKFFNDLHRTGQLTEYETEPLVVMTRYINGITFKSSGAADGYAKAIGRFNELVDKFGDHKELAPHLVVARDYTRLVQGQLPEVEGTINNTLHAIFETTGMSKHLDDASIERFTALWTGLNYGAFMGFRVATTVMNATQIGHVYMKHGAKYTALGIKAILSKDKDLATGKITLNGMDEAVEAGAVRRNHMRIPYEDQVRRQIVEGQIKGGTTVLGKVADTGLAAAELGGYMFSKTDEWLRGIAYHAQKNRALDASNKYRKLGWDGISRNQKFEQEAGLSQLGEVITQEYFKRATDADIMTAAKWLGAKSAGETQFLYQAGTGPIAFSRGAMKLFGQYGTWPAWYIDFARRGLSVGTARDKTMFALRGAAFSGGLIAAGYATGVSTARWHGPTSVFFAGGPLWDKTKDATTIWGGIARPGGPPLDTRITLSEYGIKYDEDSMTNYQLDKPGKLIQNTVGQIVPGQGLARDLVQAKDAAQEGKSTYHTLMTGLGFYMEEDE